MQMDKEYLKKIVYFLSFCGFAYQNYINIFSNGGDGKTLFTEDMEPLTLDNFPYFVKVVCFPAFHYYKMMDIGYFSEQNYYHGIGGMDDTFIGWKGNGDRSENDFQNKSMEMAMKYINNLYAVKPDIRVNILCSLKDNITVLKVPQEYLVFKNSIPPFIFVDVKKYLTLNIKNHEKSGIKGKG